MIKVCGMREADNIRAVEQLGVDWLGFIFAPRSPRYVSTPPAYLPTRAKRVGVFVDADISDILQHVRAYRLDLIQFHGHETPDDLRALASALGSVRSGSATAPATPPRLIKALSVATRDDVAAYRPYEGLVDYFLFDTKTPLRGGSGRQFDWSVLSAYDGQTPFLLSGGIGSDDADRVRAFRHPRCVGLDLNSRFETAPALKDIQKLKEFIKEIQS